MRAASGRTRCSTTRRRPSKRPWSPSTLSSTPSVETCSIGRRPSCARAAGLSRSPRILRRPFPSRSRPRTSSSSRAARSSSSLRAWSTTGRCGRRSTPSSHSPTLQRHSSAASRQASVARWCFGLSTTSRQEQKAAAFQALHAGEPFVIPNPWDAGSARVLAGLGFKALATTSSGFAFTLGRLDGEVTLDEVADHARMLDRATDLPVSVDLEHGYGRDPASVVLAVTRVAEAGAVGASIEDYDPAGVIYDFPHAAERIAAAAEAAHRLAFPFTLTARAENHLRGNPDLDDTIARLRAFEAAGADVLDAPRRFSVPGELGPSARLIFPSDDCCAEGGMPCRPRRTRHSFTASTTRSGTWATLPSHMRSSPRITCATTCAR